MRNGHCNYCEASEIGKGIWNEGKCRNCGAGLKNNLIKDKQNQFVCRYCGWPVKDKPIEDTLKPTPSTPPDSDPLPPNSPARTVQSSSGGIGLDGLEFLPMLFILIFMVLIVFTTLPVISHISANVTTTNHPVDIPFYTPGASVILLGGAFIMGILLTFVILRNRHRRELQRQRKLLGPTS
jgi:hypothetical protein